MDCIRENLLAPLPVRTSLSLICCFAIYVLQCLTELCCLAGESFPLEKVHEAILESEKTGRKGKVFLEG